jgi:hypothetical protein
MTLQEAKSIVRHLGLTLRKVRSGDYCVKSRDGNEATPLLHRRSRGRRQCRGSDGPNSERDERNDRNPSHAILWLPPTNVRRPGTNPRTGAKRLGRFWRCYCRGDIHAARRQRVGEQNGTRSGGCVGMKQLAWRKSSKTLERVKGIEPSSSAWKALGASTISKQILTFWFVSVH